MIARFLLCIVALAWALPGSAQSWPSRPITLVVPQPAGGAADALARGLADEMGKRLGTPVVVENKPGASAMLGTNAVARAQPDGYTLLVTNPTPVLLLPYMFDKLPYDPNKDLSFITQIASGQLVLVVNRDVPARNMEEFFAWAKQNKGKLAFGSFGVGTSGHLVAAYLNRMHDLDMTHVPFKGEQPMIQELVGGRIAWGLTTPAAITPHLQTGSMRALAVVADKRLKDMPDAPTMAEVGLTGPEFKPWGWFGLLGPAGLPRPVFERLEKEAREAVRTPALQARIQALGMEALGGSSVDFRRNYEQLIPVAERLVKISGAKME